jgi:hypothetical protein
LVVVEALLSGLSEYWVGSLNEYELLRRGESNDEPGGGGGAGTDFFLGTCGDRKGWKLLLLLLLPLVLKCRSLAAFCGMGRAADDAGLDGAGFELVVEAKFLELAGLAGAGAGFGFADWEDAVGAVFLGAGAGAFLAGAGAGAEACCCCC